MAGSTRTSQQMTWQMTCQVTEEATWEGTWLVTLWVSSQAYIFPSQAYTGGAEWT